MKQHERFDQVGGFDQETLDKCRKEQQKIEPKRKKKENEEAKKPLVKCIHPLRRVPH